MTILFIGLIMAARPDLSVLSSRSHDQLVAKPDNDHMSLPKERMAAINSFELEVPHIEFLVTTPGFRARLDPVAPQSRDRDPQTNKPFT